MAQRPTLIVVDDEPEILMSVAELFRTNYEVHPFKNGKEALSALTKLPKAHVLMTDQQMPGMTGVELLAQARERRPETTRLLMTGHADHEVVVNAINHGSVFRFLAKPWHVPDVETLLREAVEHHNAIVDKNRLVEELRNANERLTRVDELKTMFIEVASHELNTPVTMVLGLADLWRMVEGPTASAKERVWFDRIHTAGKRLASSVDRMFSLIKSDQFTQELDLQEYDLEPILRRVVEELRPFLEGRNQSLEIEVADSLGAAEVDHHKIADVLVNLLVNAIKFTPDGGTIQLNAWGEGLDSVLIEVLDKGIGISLEDAKHLFEPFFTGYDTMHHSSGDHQFGKRGIGLGLSVVKTFVELHGGEVNAESNPGEGSTFRVRLPRRRIRRPVHTH